MFYSVSLPRPAASNATYFNIIEVFFNFIKMGGVAKTPSWLNALSEADLNFVRSFILSSGSLKDMARLYDVSYPTIRQRLNRIIEKVSLAETESDPFELRLRSYAIDHDLPSAEVDTIIAMYRSSQKGPDAP